MTARAKGPAALTNTGVEISDAPPSVSTADAAPRFVDGRNLAAHERHPGVAGLRQQGHAELLCAQPAAAARMRDRTRGFREIGEVFLDQDRVFEQVDPARQPFEAVRRGGDVTARRAGMKPQFTGAQ